jgi:hypothetical protein
MKKDKKNKKVFEDYAIQDAIITLKRSIAKEEFNFNIKKLGVSSSLLFYE